MFTKEAVSVELSKKVAKIKAYFEKHPAQTPVSINRVYANRLF